VLSIRYAARAGRAELSSDAARAPDLQALRARYTSANTVSSQVFTVEIDDFLVNLHELATWPDGDVNWQTELLTLVESNAADTAVLHQRLRSEPSMADGAARLADGWDAMLTDCQKRDATRLLELRHGANFSVPGAGKTRVALAVFQARRAAGEVARMLVVCPKSAFESWQSEAQTCFPDGSVRVQIMTSDVLPQCEILLINYERLDSAHGSLLAWLRAQPAILTLDEAHRMKRGAAGVWGAICLALGPYAARRLILTGTPAPNGAKDLENLFGFVWPGLGRNVVSRALDGRSLREASLQLRPLFVRTTKHELDLPPYDIKARYVELPPLHREIYSALLGQIPGQWRGDEQDVEALGRILLYLLMAATTPALLATGATRYEPLPYRVPPLQPPAGSTLAELMRDLPHYELSPKYQEALAIVAANAEAGRKTLVWSTFVRSLRSLELLMERFNPAIIHGGTLDREAELHRFRTDPACMVLLSNPATLGEGVSLHHTCHDAIYVDRDFAAGRFMQSLDRIHRLGLPPGIDTNVTVLVANNTIDELVAQRLDAKLTFMGTILDDPAVLQLSDLDEEPTASAGMDSADLRALIGHLRSRVAT
jgi:SNF2 family DNA or RNA helicase